LQQNSIFMILQQAVKALDTKTLQDAAKQSVYVGRKFTDFDGRSYYWRLQELQRCSGNGIKCGDALKLQALRDYIIYRWNKDACFASQQRICEDLGIKDKETIRWMLRVLVWSGHIRKLPYNHFTGTNQYVPNIQDESGSIDGLWQEWTSQLISKAKKFTLVSQDKEEVNQEEENNPSFFESSDSGNFATNIPKEYYIEEQEEMYQQDTNTESFNNLTYLDDATLNAPHLDNIQEEVPETVDLPINIKGYTLLQMIATELGLSTIQEVLKHLVTKHLEEKEEIKNKESKSQSPLKEVVSLDATQPTGIVEKEVEQVISPVPVTPQKTVYREYELIRQQARIKNYLTGKQEEFDIPGIDELINQEKHRITRLPDDLLMGYPIPNPGIEDALQGIVNQHRTSAKRKDTAFTLGNMFKSALDNLDIEEIKYIAYTTIDALTRNDGEIMSYIVL
jgi:hypothetical protein